MGGLLPNTNITTSNEPTPPPSTVFIWNGTGAWPTALANWNSAVDPGATLDVVGGRLNTGGLIDNGILKVDGDPPALVITGLATIGSGGTLTGINSGIIRATGSGVENDVNSGSTIAFNSSYVGDKDGLIIALGRRHRLIRPPSTWSAPASARGFSRRGQDMARNVGEAAPDSARNNAG